MSAPAFTPGPWRHVAVNSRGERIRDRIVAAEEEVVFDVHEEANAHLIAAAPELYEALQLAAEIISNQFRDGFAHNDDDPDFPGLPSYYIGPGVMPKLSAALAKARGEQVSA